MVLPAKKAPVVVIGSGFGGLAAAIRQQAKGYPTTLLEMCDKPEAVHTSMRMRVLFLMRAQPLSLFHSSLANCSSLLKE